MTQWSIPCPWRWHASMGGDVLKSLLGTFAGLVDLLLWRPAADRPPALHALVGAMGRMAPMGHEPAQRHARLAVYLRAGMATASLALQCAGMCTK